MAVLMLNTVAIVGCGNTVTQTTTPTLTGVNSASSQSANGLSLSLSLDAATYQLIRTFRSLSMKRILYQKTNRVSASDKRPLSGLSLGPCNQGSPFGVAVFSGYYSSADVLKGRHSLFLIRTEYIIVPLFHGPKALSTNLSP